MINVRTIAKAAGTVSLAVMWIVGAVSACAAAMAYVRLPDALQISGAILVAGCVIAAAVWFRKPIVLHMTVDAFRSTAAKTTKESDR